MALTINSTPANISNSGAFNVTTSLVEDATHVNLRIRADITVAAVIVATSEKPKGIPVFDFFDILKACVPGLSFARNSGALYNVSGGSPLVAYTVTFTEVWENAGVTTTGTPGTTSTLKFVPAIGTGTFSDYVLSGTGSHFASLTLAGNALKFPVNFNPGEWWLVFFTEQTALQLFYSKDGGAYNSATTFTASNGWGVIILNAAQIFSGVTDNVRIQMGINGGGKISEVITIYAETGEMAQRETLEFDGIWGGKEYLDFKGNKNIEFASLRNYYTSAKKARKPLSISGLWRQTLSTRYQDQTKAPFFTGLILSETVAILEPAYATPTPCTVITESARTEASDLFVNTIEIEYEY